MAYLLYVKKSKNTLQIMEPPTVFEDLPFDDTVKRYNQYYYYSSNLSALKEFAETIRKEWLIEARQVLHDLNNLDVYPK